MWDEIVVAFMAVMGLGIATIWTRDIVSGDAFDHGAGRLRARNADGSRLLPHWVAEYATAGALLVGAAGLAAGSTWSTPAAAAALGATWYTSMNSLGWALADPSRRAYAFPMLVGLVGSTACLVVLIASW